MTRMIFSFEIELHAWQQSFSSLYQNKQRNNKLKSRIVTSPHRLFGQVYYITSVCVFGQRNRCVNSNVMPKKLISRV